VSPEQQRIAIAEACGWTIETTAHFQILHNADGKNSGFCCGKHLPIEDVWRAGLEGDENGDHKFPDYCKDLNAIHEAVLALPESYRIPYSGTLMRMMEDSAYCVVNSINATAPQRAEAFLRTIGKWVEP